MELGDVKTIKQAKRYRKQLEDSLGEYGLDYDIKQLQEKIKNIKLEKASNIKKLEEFPTLLNEMLSRPWKYVLVLQRWEEEINAPTIPEFFETLVLRLHADHKYNGYHMVEHFHYDDMDVIEEKQFHWFIEPIPDSEHRPQHGRATWRYTDKTKKQALEEVLAYIAKLQTQYPDLKVYDMLEDWQYTNEKLSVPAETDKWTREN